MTIRTFIIGMITSFSTALLLAVVVPFYKTRELQAVKYVEGIDESKDKFYFPKRTGQITVGAKVYAQNGCYVCHSQVVRPTYAGNDFHRDGWAGLKADPDRGDTRRESNAFDYQQENFAQIGLMRIGPDLSNVGVRFSQLALKHKTMPEHLLLEHLYDPRGKGYGAATAGYDNLRWSTCPSSRFLFNGERDERGALHPSPAANALVSYLMSMKKDDKVPASMNYSPVKPAAK